MEQSTLETSLGKPCCGLIFYWDGLITYGFVWTCICCFGRLYRVCFSLEATGCRWLWLCVLRWTAQHTARCAILHLIKHLCGPVSCILWGLKGYLIFSKIECPRKASGYLWLSMVNCAMCYLVYAVVFLTCGTRLWKCHLHNGTSMRDSM